MNSTGIVRKIDDLGRIVIPKELRRTMNIEVGDPMEIFTDIDNRIILRQYKPGCILTDSNEDLIDYNGVKVSKAAIKELAKLAGITK